MAKAPLDFSFQPRRAVLLARNLVAFQWRSLALAAAALASSYVFLYVATVTATGGGHLMESIWGAAFLLTAWLAAAGTFADVRRAAKAPWWFLLPASILEKAAAAVVLLVAVLVVGFPLLGLVADLAGRTVTWMVWGRMHPGLRILDPVYWWSVATGLTLVPVFLFGSVAFRRLAFVKTLLALFVSLIALGAVSVGLVWLFFGNGGPSDTASAYRLSIDLGETADRGGSWGAVWSWVGGIGFFGLVPAFFLAVTFLRLTECEVDHGVS